MPERHNHGKNIIGTIEFGFALSHSFCRCTTFWRDTGQQSASIALSTAFSTPTPICCCFGSDIDSAILAAFQGCAFARPSSGNATQPTRYHHVRSCFPVHRAGFLFPRWSSPSRGSAHLCLVGDMEWVMGGPASG